MTQTLISALVGIGLGSAVVVGGVQAYQASQDQSADRTIPTVGSPMYADE